MNLEWKQLKNPIRWQAKCGALVFRVIGFTSGAELWFFTRISRGIVSEDYKSVALAKARAQRIVDSVKEAGK